MSPPNYDGGKHCLPLLRSGSSIVICSKSTILVRSLLQTRCH